MNYIDKLGKEQNFASQVRNIQGRAVYQNGNQWIDLYAQQKPQAKETKIQFASKAYFVLLQKHPQTSQFLALGRNVCFVYKNQLYEIYE